MNRKQVESIVNDIQFRDWKFHLGNMGDDLFLQVQFVAPDTETGLNEVQHGRKWYLSSHMTRGEVVQTALAAVLMAVEHEAREDFHYQNRAIFGPHFDLNGLLDACDNNRIEVRQPHTG